MEVKQFDLNDLESLNDFRRQLIGALRVVEAQIAKIKYKREESIETKVFMAVKVSGFNLTK